VKGTDDRLVIPIPRIYLSPEHLDKPIPSLSNRQYVVDKSRKSPNQLRTETELFWYRDALLNKLHCNWLEPGSNRSGHLNLRGQGLRPALLEVLKREELGIVLDIPAGIKTAEFTELSTRIINHLGESPFFPSPQIKQDVGWCIERPIDLRITIEPLPSLDPTFNRRITSVALKNLLIDGSLTTDLTIEQGKEGEHVVPLLFLARGVYGFRAIVQETSGGAVLGSGLVNFSSVLEVKVD
jgi:hypothetical protein